MKRGGTHVPHSILTSLHNVQLRTTEKNTVSKAIGSLLEGQSISAASQESTSSSVLGMLASIFTTDLIEAETSSLSIGKAIEILGNEKNKLEKSRRNVKSKKH